MTLKALTAHIRHRIAVAGIKARVRMSPAGGAIQVFPVSHSAQFDEAAQRAIRHIAACNHMTLVQGMPIDVERMTDPHGMEFYPAA